MGAVRSFTPAGYLTGDDLIFDVVLPFTFWGYERATVLNNGGVSFHPNYIVDANSNCWDDLGWEYCWSEPLASGAPSTEYMQDIYGVPWFRPVGIFPFVTDIETSADDYYAVQEVSYGTDTIEGKSAFLVTWSEVTLYDLTGGVDQPVDIPRNTFQVVIYEDDTWEMNYDKIEWTTPYSWTSVAAPNYGVTEPSQIYVHALAGYRMVAEEDARTLEFTYTGGTGTLTVGDTLRTKKSGSYGYAFWTVTGITGDSASGTATCLMAGQESNAAYESVPLGWMWNDDTYPDYQIAGTIRDVSPTNVLTTDEGWSATLVSEFWHNNDPAYETVDEFDWSRTITIVPDTSLDTLADQLDTYVDGGDESVVASRGGRYLSEYSLNFVPQVTLDVDLEGTLISDRPAPEGELDVVIDPTATLSLGTFYATGQLDVIVEPEASVVWGGPNPSAQATLSLEIDPGGSVYFERSSIDTGFGRSGNWANIYTYDPQNYVGPDGWPTVTYPSTGGHDGGSHRRVQYLSTCISPVYFGYMHSDPNYWLYGMSVDISIWVNVVSGGEVRLQVIQDYNQQFVETDYASTALDDPVILDEAATTLTGTWEKLTVTIPQSRGREWSQPRIRMLRTNGTTIGEYLTDSREARFYGLVDEPFTAYATGDNGTNANAFQYHVPAGDLVDLSFGYDNGITVSADYAHRGVNAFKITSSGRPSSDYLPGTQVYEYSGWGMSTPHSYTYSSWATYGGSVRASMWVYIPTGAAPVRLRCYHQLAAWGQGVSTDRTWALTTDVVPPVTSTVHDQWELLSIDIPSPSHVLRNVNSHLNFSANNYNQMIVGVETTSPDDGQTLYVDDIGYEIYQTPSTFPLLVASYLTPMKQNVVDVELTGTLSDLNVQASGSIDVDVDVMWLSPYTELISGSLDVAMDTNIGWEPRTFFWNDHRPGYDYWLYGFEDSYQDSWDASNWSDSEYSRTTGQAAYYTYTQMGGHAPTGGKDSINSLLVVSPAIPEEITQTPWVTWEEYFQYRGYDLRIVLWIWNPSPNAPLHVQIHDSYAESQYTTPTPIVTTQTTMNDAWEMVVLLVPWDYIADYAYQGRYLLEVGITPTDKTKRTTYYLDNTSAIYHLNEASTRKWVHSV